MSGLISWLPPLICLAVVLALGGGWPPWLRLLATTIGMISALKLTVLLRQKDLRTFSLMGLWLYLTAWPGMNPEPFRLKPDSLREGTRPTIFTGGITRMMVGLGANLVLIGFAPQLNDAWLSGLGIAALFLTLHLGFADVLAAILRRGGWPVAALCDAPWQSRSLGQFWGRRWNSAFVEMNHLLFLPLLQIVAANLIRGSKERPAAKKFCAYKAAVFVIFLISGLLHELAISFPAGGGWGGPLAYFALQGALVMVESRSSLLARQSAGGKRLWTWFWIFAPAPLLFHAPFRDTLIIPWYRSLHMFIF